MNNAKYPAPAKGKKRFNVIDAVIIILILLIAGAAVYVFVFTKAGMSGNEATETIEYQLWYDRQRTELSDRIKVGDKVYDWGGDYLLGEVMAVDVLPAMVDSYDKTTGQMISVPYPDRYAVYVTVRAEASKKNEAYYVGPVRIVVGARINTRYPDFQATASCVQVTGLSPDA